MEIKLNLRTTPFNIDYTLKCGQVFRWKKIGQNWLGVVDETLIIISQRENKIYYKTYPEEKSELFIKRYFRLDDDLISIASQINKDKTIRYALNRLHGLRIIRQNIWECLISFTCATFSNIFRIKTMIQNICQRFGRKNNFKGFTFYSFPRKEVLAEASINELLNCKLGYRATYIKKVSQLLIKGILNVEDLWKMTYKDAKKALKGLEGVGDKVADCVLLFSLEKLEAFPVDVWIKRILQTYYSYHLQLMNLKKEKLTLKSYRQLSDFGRTYFGKYAGYAQEYLYANFSHIIKR